MKARHPLTKELFYFVDKCLPFGASISCAHFQCFSDALYAIVVGITQRIQRSLLTNYLDDFLFIYFTEEGCNRQVCIFLNICNQIQFPVSLEKTEWASTQIVFLGMLLNGVTFTLSIAVERRDEILYLVKKFKCKTKATIKELQSLAGHLNFINHAVVPGRAFTHRMYAKFSGSNILDNKGRVLKPHHHVKLDKEFRLDCTMWEYFLEDLNAVTRPFIDMSDVKDAKALNFFSDASAAKTLGMGAIFGDNWLFAKWEPGFIDTYKPSIGFLELYALCAGILTWSDRITKTRVMVYCDNMSAVQMVNNLSSSCEQCMKLIRILTLDNLKHYRRVFVRHIEGRKNVLSDALSRLQFDKFFKLAPATVKQYPDDISTVIWPVTKLWLAPVFTDLL